MKRRTFLGTGSAFLSTLPHLASAAPPRPQTHAALVIGISETSKLPVLRSPVPQARILAALLEREGYDVRLHVDDGLTEAERENMVWDIKTSARELSRKDGLTQLVIFFSGHGFWSPEKEDIWLLPYALRDADQAIHVKTLEQLIYSSRIPNVILIGDACRSLPDPADDAQSRVRGSGLLPSPGTDAASVKIDRFYAARSTKPAFEIENPADGTGSFTTAASNQYESLFSKAILNAFTDPPAGILKPVDGRDVITNRQLWYYLEDEMKRLADAYELIENTSPFIEVPSRDNIYITGPHPLDTIALADDLLRDARLPETDPRWSAREPSDRDVIAEAFARQAVPITATKGLPRTAEYDANLQKRLFSLREQQTRIAPIVDLPLGDQPAGIAVYGATVTDIGTTADYSYIGVMDGETAEGTPATAEVFAAYPPDTGASAVLSFNNGTGCVLALLDSYVAHVFVTDQGAGMIAYEPVPGSDAWYEFESFGQQRTDLRGLVTLALKNGVFGVDDSFSRAAGDGQTFADRVRFLKFSDPTLGIYAAYGYAQAGIQGEVREIEKIQSGRNQLAPIFDNVLLARDNVAEGTELLENVVPFCPMLRNGWSYLPVKGVTVPDKVQDALQYLTPSVWTSFTEPGVAILIDAIKSGVLR